MFSVTPTASSMTAAGSMRLRTRTPQPRTESLNLAKKNMHAFFVFFFAFCVMYSLSGSLDTKRSHVTLSLHAWVHARSPLEFCHQADVVARPLRVRQAAVLGANSVSYTHLTLPTTVIV